jgi:uncharacterized protein YyaL (SSP411 family)
MLETGGGIMRGRRAGGILIPAVIAALCLIPAYVLRGADGNEAQESDVSSETETWNSRNRLSGTGSPYLEDHAENPVHWLPWGEEAFEAARAADLPILVSIGYSTCHWCHVMARESFEDGTVAALMNASQVNIKVDREQHPGVDALYMEAAQALNGSGGWPLNVFVNHDGRPFLALTYLPPDRWVRLVAEVNRLWRTDRDRVDQAAAALGEHLREKNYAAGPDPSELPSALMEASRKYYDSGNPGFAMGSSPMKFPPSQTIDWLMEHGGNEGLSMALDILTAMMDSGLHDRVGGGFHRYSTDAGWRVPHFEKMAYDNAQLMGLYARASRLAGPGVLSDDLLAAARNTADWFLREMRVYSENGGFLGYATAADADDPAGEGAYYAWPPAALAEVLGEQDAAWLADRWNLSGEGTLAGAAKDGHYEPAASWIPHPRGAAGYPESYRPSGTGAGGREREAELLPVLRSARSVRPAPMRDSKVLTDQNALVLEGFVRMARYVGGTEYESAARELAEVLIGKLGPDAPRVSRAPGLDAFVTDYGYLAMALAGYYSLSGDPRAIDAAEVVAREALERLSTGDGAFYSTPAGDGTLFKRGVEDFDGPSPAGAHALGIAFARLYSVTGGREWKERADGLLNARGSIAALAPNGTPTLVRLASLRERPYTLVVAGPAGDPRTAELLELARRLTGPDQMVVAADAAAAGGSRNWAELEGRTGLAEPQLLVCREGSCLLPAFTGSEAAERLRQIGQGR